MENKPTTIEECHEFFDNFFLREFKDELKTDKNVLYGNPSFGRQVRNNFGLWDTESELSKYFNSIGIDHADDMYGIIMDSYICKLNNEPFDLDEQVKFYQDYWEKMRLGKKWEHLIKGPKDKNVKVIMLEPQTITPKQ